MINYTLNKLQICYNIREFFFLPVIIGPKSVIESKPLAAFPETWELFKVADYSSVKVRVIFITLIITRRRLFFCQVCSLAEIQRLAMINSSESKQVPCHIADQSLQMKAFLKKKENYAQTNGRQRTSTIVFLFPNQIMLQKIINKRKALMKQPCLVHHMLPCYSQPSAGCSTYKKKQH